MFREEIVCYNEEDKGSVRMAKRKKRKDDKKKTTGYHVELIGILLILIAILGAGSKGGFGPVGKLIGAFAAFLVGAWYNLLLVAVFVVGVYMMVKRERPNYFTSKLVGLYVFCIGILVFSHLSYITKNDLQGFDILKETVLNFMASTKSMMNIQGGGLIGALVSILFVTLFDVAGTKIVAWALIICGIVLFTGVSIADMIKAMKTKLDETNEARLERKKQRAIEREKERKEALEKQEEESEPSVTVADESNLRIDEETGEILGENLHPLNGDQPIVQEVKEEKKQKPYVFPPLSLLAKPKPVNQKGNEVAVEDNKKILNQVLTDFGIEGHIVNANIGPSVTQYELDVKAGTKVSKILGIHRELALALAVKDVKIEAPIPGKRTIGIEVPNKVTTMVTVREILEKVPPKLKDSKLLVTLGKNVMGAPVFCEINKTPHLLVAGATGSGKSVCINSILISILMRTKPEEVKLVLVDPKKVELSMYNGVPHLLAPVVTDPKKANIALKKIVVEMERRYEVFSDSGTKNITSYNNYIDKYNEGRPKEEQKNKLPFIVVIIDELADLMLVAAKEVEDSIMRITQMARAAGIHLIVATQRPSTDVITGVVKANIPSRISFAVSSQIDSRTILDQGGAEKLLGKGDMLFLPQGESSPIRVQGTFIDEDEIKRVVDHVIKQQIAKYDNSLTMDDEELHATTMVEEKDDYDEPLYNEIVDFVIQGGKASASLLQRRFRLGYNRAARAMDLLEERGIVGPPNGSKPREVLVKKDANEEE